MASDTCLSNSSKSKENDEINGSSFCKSSETKDNDRSSCKSSETKDFDHSLMNQSETADLLEHSMPEALNIELDPTNSTSSVQFSSTSSSSKLQNQDSRSEPLLVQDSSSEPQPDFMASKIDNQIKEHPINTVGIQACLPSLGSLLAADRGGGSSSQPTGPNYEYLFPNKSYDEMRWEDSQIGDRDNQSVKVNNGFRNEDSLIERDGNKSLADSMPGDNASSFSNWKERVDLKLRNLEYCNYKFDERIIEMKMDTVMEVKDENFNEVQEKKAHGIMTIILLAITVFIGYIIYLFQLAKKCTGFVLAMMIMGIIGVIAFGGAGIWTMMEVPLLLGEVSTETRFKCRFLISIATVCLFAILYLIFGYVVEKNCQ